MREKQEHGKHKQPSIGETYLGLMIAVALALGGERPAWWAEHTAEALSHAPSVKNWELTNGAPCLGLVLGLAVLAWAGVSAVVLLVI